MFLWQNAYANRNLSFLQNQSNYLQKVNDIKNFPDLMMFLDEANSKNKEQEDINHLITEIDKKNIELGGNAD